MRNFEIKIVILSQKIKISKKIEFDHLYRLTTAHCCANFDIPVAPELSKLRVYGEEEGEGEK